MSRTYRRKSGDQSDLHWVLRDRDWIWVDGDDLYQRHCVVETHVDRNSKEGKKRLAKYYSDAGTHRCREPGPMWFIRETAQRPYRRRANNEIRKFMRNPEHEVMIESMPHRDYWT